MAQARIDIHRGDITELDVDALVNAANSRLVPGGGVDGAINRAAGPELARAMAAHGGCPTGEARVTPGFALRARHVIHTVGPVWNGGGEGEDELLASCYRHALDLARENGVRSIAFPAISAGVYGFPLRRAAGIAVETVERWLAENDTLERVVFCVFDRDVEAVYREALSG